MRPQPLIRISVLSAVVAVLGAGIAVTPATSAQAYDATFEVVNHTGVPLNLVSKSSQRDSGFATASPAVNSVLRNDVSAPHRFNSVWWFGQDNRSSVLYNIPGTSMTFAVSWDLGKWASQTTSSCGVWAPIEVVPKFRCSADGLKIDIWTINTNYTLSNESTSNIVLKDKRLGSGSGSSVPIAIGTRYASGTAANFTVPWDLKSDLTSWTLTDAATGTPTGDTAIAEFKRDLTTSVKSTTCRIETTKQIAASACFSQSPNTVRIMPMKTIGCAYAKSDFTIGFEDGVGFPRDYRTGLEAAIAEYHAHTNIRFSLGIMTPSRQTADIIVHDIHGPPLYRKSTEPAVTVRETPYCVANSPQPGQILIDETVVATSFLSRAETLKLIFMHELGHIVGLDHPASGSPSIMVANANEVRTVAFTPYDLAMLYSLYPKPPTG